MLEMRRLSAREDCSESRPGIGRCHVDNPNGCKPRLRRLDPEQLWWFAALDAAPELSFSSNDKVLIERIGTPQLQHNMWVVGARSAVLSVITGGGKWVEITTHVAATLDGRVEATGAVFEAKFMLPWSFSEDATLRLSHIYRQPSNAPTSLAITERLNWQAGTETFSRSNCKDWWTSTSTSN